MKKSFPIIDVLSTYTRILLGEMGGVYDVLGFMCGEELSTIQLICVSEEANPYLEEQYPWLKEVCPPSCKTLPGISQDQMNTAIRNFVDNMIERYGATVELRPMHHEDHEVLDVETDALRLNPNLKIINFGTTPDEPNPTGDINWKVE